MDAWHWAHVCKSWDALIAPPSPTLALATAQG